jgi:hypothetical protein
MSEAACHAGWWATARLGRLCDNEARFVVARHAALPRKWRSLPEHFQLPEPTQRYDRRSDEVTLDEVERIRF